MDLKMPSLEERMLNIRGCGTALVTPFSLQDSSVDLESYQRLVTWQIESGIDFLVPCGTTGESVTLDDKEYAQVIRTCVETASGAVPIVAGAGTNDTVHAIRLSRIAQDQGVDAILSVTPYYNKPSADGIFLHFSEIAQNLDIPMVVYNVPGRTGTNIGVDTQIRLAGVENIFGVKEASGNLDQIMDLLVRRPKGFVVFSGDDSLAFPMACLGAEGVISVASNLIPAEMSLMMSLIRQQNVEDARDLHNRYLNLMNLNFVESNPIPVKYALSRMGFIAESYRLPLCHMTPANKKKMDQELNQFELSHVSNN